MDESTDVPLFDSNHPGHANLVTTHFRPCKAIKEDGAYARDMFKTYRTSVKMAGSVPICIIMIDIVDDQVNG